MFGAEIAGQHAPVITIPVLILSFVVYVVLGLVPAAGGLYLIYFLLTLPMRRNERARMFLDLLELGLKQNLGLIEDTQDIVGTRRRSCPHAGLR